MNSPGEPGRADGRRGGIAALAALVLVALTAGVLAVVPLAPATADTVPSSPSVPETVSADALPTVQINGVVWDQVIVGDRVYATGRFTQARPAGAAAGTNQTPRSNILAYNINTGALITTWAPTLNAQGMVIERSADGSTIYVGGDFTSVSGQNRQRVVALDAQTGAVRAGFAPVANTRVEALAVSGNTLYLGGYFTTMSGQPRSRLAAVNATTGALLPWAPTADREIVSMVATSGRVIVGGSITTVNGQQQRGMASLDAATGDLMPWAVNQTVQNYGANTQISDLYADGELVYGTAWAFYASGDPEPTAANFEGTFAAEATTGAIRWLNGCRGDQYSVTSLGDALYTAGHPHECGMVGFRPETNPRTWQWAVAQDKRGTPGKFNEVGSYADWGHFDGLPASQMLHWLPTFSPGTVSGSGQAGWSVAASDQYVVYGGEFPRVNGVNQQGLVRFAVRSIAPNNAAIQGFPEMAPTLTPLGAGKVRIEWQAAWDRDNERLTYEVLRGATTGSSTVLKTFTYDSNWWTRPRLGFVDTTAPPGSSQTYRIRVRDPLGNGFAASAATITVPAGTVTNSSYHETVVANGAFHLWRLGEDSGTTANDWASGVDLTLSSQAQRGTAGALLNEPDTATTWPGTTSTSTVQGVNESWTINAQDAEPQAGPQTFSIETWFRTTSTQGGKLVGFGDSRTGRSGSNRNDRNLYLTDDGQVRFGLRPDVGDRLTIQSQTGLNDDQWHHVVATLSPAGATLYVDGQQVANDPTLNEAQHFYGYWRVAGDRLSSWPSAPSREAFAGSLDEVAIYPSALTLGQVRANYEASGRDIFPNVPPVAEFASSVQDATVSVDGAQSQDPDGDEADLTYSWSFGDGGTGSGITAQHTYAAAGTYDVTLTVTDGDGAPHSVMHPVTVADPPPPPTELAVDAFGRSVAGGFGSADLGGPWTLQGPASNFSVSGGVGRMNGGAGATRAGYLEQVSAVDQDIEAAVSLDRAITGNGAYVSLTGRRVSNGNDYRLKLQYRSNGTVGAFLERYSGGAQTQLTFVANIPGLTMAPNQVLRVRLQVVGTSSTLVRGKVWRDGTAEPAAWLVSANDAAPAALQGPGHPGVHFYTSGSWTGAGAVLSVDDLRAVPPE